MRLCNAQLAKIRPQLTVIGCHVDSCSFVSATFGENTSFDFTTFGNNAHFHSATFGNFASFRSATFGHDALFFSTTFGYGTTFHSASFGVRARFESTKFGGQACFDFAIFGDWSRFESATFDSYASFDGAAFGDDAQFSETTFGDKAGFDDVTFHPSADFLNARFGPGGGIGGIVVASVHHGKKAPARLLADRPRRWLAVHISWNTIRAAGESAILSRVSMLALVIVPIVAGCWPAVRALVHGYALGLGESKGAYESARAALLLEAAKNPASQLEVTGIVERLDTQVTAITAQMNTLYTSEVALPISWSLLFFGALAVTLARTVYGWGAPPEVRERSRDEAMAAEASEFREKKDQKRDLLLRAITRLQRAAEVLPEVRHPSFVKRHGAAVWVPKSMEEVDTLEKTHKADAETRTNAEGFEDAEALSKLRPPMANTPEAMEIILIEEGAAAEYDLKSHKAPVRMHLAGFLYAVGAYCIAWLIVHQSTAILKQTRGGAYLPDYWAETGLVLACGWIGGLGLVMLPWLWERITDRGSDGK